MTSNLSTAKVYTYNHQHLSPELFVENRHSQLTVQSIAERINLLPARFTTAGIARKLGNGVEVTAEI